MNPLDFLTPVLVLCLLASGVGALLALLPAFRTSGTDPATAAARRRLLLATVAASAAGLAALPLLLRAADPHLIYGVGPLGVGAVMVLAVAGVEHTWPRPEGRVRVASLRSPLPTTGLAARVWPWAGASVVALCVLGTMLADRTGADVSISWPTGSATGGAFPGWRYSLPTVLALLALWAAVRWAGRVVDARPSPGPEHELLDARVRAISQARVLRIGAAATLTTVVGLTFMMGSALQQLAQRLRMLESPAAHQPPTDWRQDLAFLLFGLGIAAVLLLVPVVTGGDPVRERPDVAARRAVEGAR